MTESGAYKMGYEACADDYTMSEAEWMTAGMGDDDVGLFLKGWLDAANLEPCNPPLI